MSDVMNQAFHFDSLVWDWVIGIYLFLTGMSAGGAMLAVYLKRNVIAGDASDNGVIKAVAIFAPLGIIVGLVILIFHLERPWTFWKIMLHYNPTSVMSMGVLLFQVYMIALFAWIGVVFQHPIVAFLSRWSGLKNLVDRVLTIIKRMESGLEWILAILAFLLAAYTGFLLSALKTYPLLNNPVLPVLFVFSSLSSGVAACLLFGVLFGKEPTNSDSVHWIHSIEKPIVLFEFFVLCAFFSGLYFGGGQKSVAVITAIGGGFWANWFWIGVIGIGMVLPLVLNVATSTNVQHNKGFIACVAGLSLLGVLMLRIFILYAGQMTLA